MPGLLTVNALFQELVKGLPSEQEFQQLMGIRQLKNACDAFRLKPDWTAEPLRQLRERLGEHGEEVALLERLETLLPRLSRIRRILERGRGRLGPERQNEAGLLIQAIAILEKNLTPGFLRGPKLLRLARQQQDALRKQKWLAYIARYDEEKNIYAALAKDLAAAGVPGVVRESITGKWSRSAARVLLALLCIAPFSPALIEVFSVGVFARNPLAAYRALVYKITDSLATGYREAELEERYGIDLEGAEHADPALIDRLASLLERHPPEYYLQAGLRRVLVYGEQRDGKYGARGEKSACTIVRIGPVPFGTVQFIMPTELEVQAFEHELTHLRVHELPSGLTNSWKALGAYGKIDEKRHRLAYGYATNYGGTSWEEDLCEYVGIIAAEPDRFASCEASFDLYAQKLALIRRYARELGLDPEHVARAEQTLRKAQQQVGQFIRWQKNRLDSAAPDAAEPAITGEVMNPLYQGALEYLCMLAAARTGDQKQARELGAKVLERCAHLPLSFQSAHDQQQIDELATKTRQVLRQLKPGTPVQEPALPEAVTEALSWASR